MISRVLLILCLSCGPAMAACPPASEGREARLGLLIGALRTSDGPGQAQEITDQIWALWFVAPDERAQSLLDDASRRMRMGDYVLAELILNDLTAYCPAYAEAWNQRAFARFLKGDMDGSLADIERVLQIEPSHFGALAGQVRVLLSMGRVRAARSVLDRALTVHPWLPERSLLPNSEKI